MGSDPHPPSEKPEIEPGQPIRPDPGRPETRGGTREVKKSTLDDRPKPER
jgi:hypothetical protein